MRKFCVPHMPYVRCICAAARVHSCSQTSAFSITSKHVIILCSPLGYAHARKGSVWAVEPATRCASSRRRTRAKNPARSRRRTRLHLKTFQFFFKQAIPYNSRAIPSTTPRQSPGSCGCGGQLPGELGDWEFPAEPGIGTGIGTPRGLQSQAIPRELTTCMGLQSQGSYDLCILRLLYF
ncbi:hypothetical protein T492DRAFT_193265 [Pavlovales sp. CCMP2436]|nr:hypothetical protein T492DRAFT_193265 [Pavlovales sp. CCMP2436]